MSINDPILEMLSFAVENELSLSSRPTTHPGPPAPAPSSSSISSTASRGLEGSSEASLEASGDAQGQGQNHPVNDIVNSLVLLGEEDGVGCLFPSCPFRACGYIYGDKKLEGEFLAHLLTEHKLVIENADEIANWTKYLAHWRDRLEGRGISEFCVGFLMEEPPKPVGVSKKRKKPSGDGSDQSQKVSNSKEEGDSSGVAPGPSPCDPDKEVKPTAGSVDQMYFMLSPVLPEDSQLRKQLWKRRLEVVLEVNRQEREDTSFSRRCLFCRDIVTGNRTHYFTHMRDSHSFHIGQADNLVFIKELLQLIEDKLNRLECLFCEHIFKDKVVLKEHMRKKQHRQLNPKNHEYDRFYVVNYLEPGKTWETIQLEDTEDEKREDEWIEPTDEKDRNVVCLFCKVANSDFPTVLEHMKTEHKFDFLTVTATLDFYQKIKLVNYIRRTVYQNSCLCCEKRFSELTPLLLHFQSNHGAQDLETVLLRTELWNQPEYFFSTYDNDDFLTCLDSGDNPVGGDALSSEDESNVMPEDLPHIDITNREFDLAGFAIRYHNQSN